MESHAIRQKQTEDLVVLYSYMHLELDWSEIASIIFRHGLLEITSKGRSRFLIIWPEFQ